MNPWVVAVRAALPSPRPQGWQALQMACGLASPGRPVTLIGDAALPDGGPETVDAWWGGSLPDTLSVRVPPRWASPPWAGVQFRRSLAAAASAETTLLCRDPRVAGAQPQRRWRAVVMEWHVQPNPSDPRHRAALTRPDLHVTVAPGLVADLAAAGVARERIRLLPNACGLSRERALLRTPRADGPVLALGLHRRDGLDEVLDAWRLDPCLPTLLIAGRDQGGSRVARWRARLTEQGLAGRVRLIGPRWGVARDDLLDTVSAWLAPYPDDATTRTRLCPLQVVDALGSGLPLIAPSLGSVQAAAAGAPWHEYTPGDPASLAAAVRGAVQSPRVSTPAGRPTWADRAHSLVAALAQQAVA